VIYARLRDWAAVEDVLQEVAVALAKDPVPKGVPPVPWLRRVAIRQALLFRRQHDRQRRRETLAAQRQQDFAGNGKPTPADPLAWLLAQERARLVHAAVEQLPPVDAELLMLKYGDDWSYEKLAEHLGISVSAVQSRLHRARNRLREVISKMAVEPS
jgi:RNA polymerase sigma-70 factor (ECF subfamily)